ncbi:hypothetical protein ACHAWF_008776 [Thalassiosira exigua]
MRRKAEVLLLLESFTEEGILLELYAEEGLVLLNVLYTEEGLVLFVMLYTEAGLVLFLDLYAEEHLVLLLKLDVEEGLFLLLELLPGRGDAQTVFERDDSVVLSVVRTRHRTSVANKVESLLFAALHFYFGCLCSNSHDIPPPLPIFIVCPGPQSAIVLHRAGALCISPCTLHRALSDERGGGIGP